jgi:hypothetical protein
VVSSHSDSAARQWTATVTHSTGGWVEPTVGLKKEKFLPQTTTTTTATVVVVVVVAAAATTTTTTTTNNNNNNNSIINS